MYKSQILKLRVTYHKEIRHLAVIQHTVYVNADILAMTSLYETRVLPPQRGINLLHNTRKLDFLIAPSHIFDGKQHSVRF